MSTAPPTDEVLATTVLWPDGAAGSLQRYLADILAALWDEGDTFDPRRPLGESDWQWVIYEALVSRGHVPGVIDPGGEGSSVDLEAADAVVTAAIRRIGCIPLNQPPRAGQVFETAVPCRVHTKHMPSTHVNERHHVWPLGAGGPNIADNIVVVCATGHNNIHRLLDEYHALRGSVPYTTLRTFAFQERTLAQLGYERSIRGAM